ncbi:centrosomal protein of 55 kDa [Gadus morhua]|uniref:Centrosomal protein 55 like n=1 Tax=Gadus morhua TaxID=8049 RepID=A0A8C4ZKC6_GADMO|nr:centrosomal protein of 55 kDa [Gadus morhua]
MSKGAKETIATRLGFKSVPAGPSKQAEADLERVRKENAHLRRKMDELTKRHVKPPDLDKSKLLERIISLETLRERNNQQLLVREQEMEVLRQQLTARGGEVVASLQAQLEQRRRDAEQRDRAFQSLAEEADGLRKSLAATAARCRSLEAQTAQIGAAPSGDLAVVNDQLRDALEKNQQWLAYDHQREAYVRSVLARTVELEQQLAQTSQASPEAPKVAAVLPEVQTHSDQLVQGLQKGLEAQREAASRAHLELQQHKEQTSSLSEELRRQKEEACGLQEELASLQRSYKERSRELEHSQELLQAERLSNRQVVSEERMVSLERRGKMREELEDMDTRLEEERKRSADLLAQVNLLQKSILSQTEEQSRLAMLEQQIQLSAKDFENEKLDRQGMQHQLQKVLKELRKARDQITRLESKPSHTRFSEPSLYHTMEFERLAVSPSRVGNLLDESFLECPKCRASYPTSQHRELLAHIDYCLA